jgi:hypothetical protein
VLGPPSVASNARASEDASNEAKGLGADESPQPTHDKSAASATEVAGTGRRSHIKEASHGSSKEWHIDHS